MPARASAAPEGSWRNERDLQRHLQALQERARTIQADLADLQGSLPYQILFDGQRVSGLTQSRLESAMGAVEDLWQGFTVLSEVLAEAATVVGNGVRPDLEQLRDVEWLLFDDSVDLGGQRYTPDGLLDDLVQALSVTAQIVEEADDVWRRTVPALARCEEEVHALQGRATEMGPAHPVDSLRHLRTQVAWLREQAAVDPLGVVEAFERDVLPRVEQTRVRLTEELRQHRAMAGDLGRARARLTEVRDLHARVVEEAGSVWGKIAHPRGLLVPPDPSYLSEAPMGLEPWLARLQALSRAGSFRQVRKGLAGWIQAADEAMSREREVLEVNREPLRRRQELRGLLSSLQAKAAALNLARDPALADIGTRARAILHAAQTDLDEAAQFVREYGDRLRVLNNSEE
jgi:hypothetical protein